MRAPCSGASEADHALSLYSRMSGGRTLSVAGLHQVPFVLWSINTNLLRPILDAACTRRGGPGTMSLSSHGQA